MQVTAERAMTDGIEQVLRGARKPLLEKSRGFTILLVSMLVIVALGAGIIGYTIGQQPPSIVIRILLANER